MIKNFGTLKRILKFTKRYWYLFPLTLIFVLMSVGLGLYSTILIGEGVDAIVGVGNVDFRLLTAVIYKLFAVMLGVFVSEWCVSLFTNILALSTVRDIRNTIFFKLNEVPLKYIDRHTHGEIMSRMLNDVDQISEGLILGFTQLFSGVVTILATLVFMFYYNYKIALVVVLVTPISLFASSFIAKYSYKMFRTQSKKRGEMTSLAEETLTGIKVIKAFGQEENIEQKFEVINEELKVYGTKATFSSSWTNPITRFINSIVYICVGIIGAFEVIKSAGSALPFTVGMFSCFLAYASKYTKPFNEISGVVTELQSAIASGGRIFEILDAEAEPCDKNLPALTDVKGNITLDRVYFCYIDTMPLIQNFNLSVSSGQKIAIVGPTGCGKTTLINLLMRFYDVKQGEIRVENTPINEVTRQSLRANYGMVLQETWLKKGTVRANIAYGKPDASDEEIIDKAKQAHIHSAIMQLPDGYDTIISEENTLLSQGQKQLLCIARVMLTLPPMLILDEATSSIDTRTEIKIQQAFAKMMRGRTTFVVAHRLSTIMKSDCILVMKDGNIIEQGTHEELLAKGGFYYKMFNSQFNII